jgi:hypothetical protein
MPPAQKYCVCCVPYVHMVELKAVFVLSVNEDMFKVPLWKI